MSQPRPVPRRALQGITTALYPAGFGMAYVLLSFAEFPTPTGDIVRPLVVVGIGSLLLVGVLAAVLRNLHRAAIGASAILVGLSAPFLLVAVMGAALAWAVLLVARRGWSWSTVARVRAADVSRAASVFAAALLVVALVIAAPHLAGGIYLVDHPDRPPSDDPDVVVLLLDGYPRSDTLAEIYGYDNRAFESGLERLGFQVSRGSLANYPHTWLTLTSMMEGGYLDEAPELVPPPDDPAEQYRRLMRSLNQSRMPDLLRQRGYEVAVIPSPFRSVALQTADRYLDGGQLSVFEYSLITYSQLSGVVTGLLPDFLMAQQRDRFHATLAEVVRLAGDDRSGPIFLFAHLFSPPHAPLVYGRNGEHLPLPGCVPRRCALWEFPDDAWDGLGDQIHYANGQILRAVGDVVERSPDATIILMSDHGSRRDPADLDEYFHTFFAARTSRTPPYPADISPVNVLRLLAGEEALPYRGWMFADELEPLVLRPFSPAP